MEAYTMYCKASDEAPSFEATGQEIEIAVNELLVTEGMVRVSGAGDAAPSPVVAPGVVAVLTPGALAAPFVAAAPSPVVAPGVVAVPTPGALVAPFVAAAPSPVVAPGVLAAPTPGVPAGSVSGVATFSGSIEEEEGVFITSLLFAAFGFRRRLAAFP